MTAKRSLLAAMLAIFVGPQAAHGQTPDIDAIVAKYEEWRTATALPALELVPAGEAPQVATGSRIGGAVWLPEGEEWPRDKAGKRMTFLAQIDFAAMPPLPDYPTTGVLQFFIARDDLYGINFENPQQGDFRVMYREDLTSEGRLEHGPVAAAEGLLDDFSPLYTSVVNRGVALTAQPFAHKPSIGVWQFHGAVMAQADTASHDALYDHIGESESESDTSQQSNWRVGGHPEFTQSDWRYETEFRDVDRVLLQLWTSDWVLMWGDSGQGHFAIRREDLLKRDFSKVFYSWDCY